MRDEAAKKRGTVLVVLLVVVTLVAAIWTSGIFWHVLEAFSSQPYKCSSTSITAQVNSDGSLLLTEQRTFTFSDKVTSLRWKHDTLSSTSKISMRDVRVAVLDENGNAVSSTELSEVPFQESWRNTTGADGVGPGTPCYSIDDEYETVYTFYDCQDATVVYTIDYTVQNGLLVWHDVAELNWTTISSDWQMDSENVTVTLSLPTPVGVEATAGSNVYAWSHGPQDGEVGVDSAGIVSYRSANVKQGQWAFLHVAFPSEWLTNLPNTKEATQYASQPHLSSILTSESTWLDQTNAGKVRGNQLDIALLAVCLALLVLSLIAYLVRGRDHKPRPLADPDAASSLHPAIEGRLMRWNHESAEDIVATVARLEEMGAVTVESDDQGFVLCRCADFDDAGADPVDLATLDLLFSKLGGECERLPIFRIAGYAEQEPSAFHRAIRSWQSCLTGRVADAKYFDAHSFRWQKVLVCLAIVLVLVGVALKIAANSDTLLGASLATGVIIALLGNYIPRRTQEGQDLAAQLCEHPGESEEHAEASAAQPDAPAWMGELLQALNTRPKRKEKGSHGKILGRKRDNHDDGN